MRSRCNTPFETPSFAHAETVGFVAPPETSTRTEMQISQNRTGLSLEYKLPLLITALLVATMAAGTFVAFLEVKPSAIENIRTRLEFLTRDLANVLGPAISQ